MTDIAISSLASRFQIPNWVVKSWIELKGLNNSNIAESFFKENIQTIKAQPFVKWVGGKRQLIEQFQSLLPSEFNDYFEPFLWGGAVFFNLQKRKSYLSDINDELINTYQIIKTKPENLIRFLKTLEYTPERYYEIRAWDREKNWKIRHSAVKRAGRFIYLNRTCFNGLHRVNSRGEFNVPVGRYKNPDFVQADNIRNVSKLLNETEAEIRNETFEHVLEKAKSGDFVYFDPPYDTLTDSANFTSYNESGFWRDMQKRLSEVFRELDKRGCKVMLSNHDTPLIRQLYEGFRMELVDARRNVNRDGSGRSGVKEIVVLNY